ncbi:MAG TPA: amidohydrolase family protein [Caulobacteraceae bacterium]
MTHTLLIRNVEVDGRARLDVRIDAGRIVEIGPRLVGRGDELDGRGGALIPGLADHHIHILGLAAQRDSVDLQGVASAKDFAERIAAAARARPRGGWIRAVGYHERIAGEITRLDLDRLAPGHRVRVQHQTGSLWILNSRALESLGGDDPPACVERDAQGRMSGRIWRGDAWLRARIGSQVPPLAPVGHQLATYGVTALTDASVTTDADAAGRLADAWRAGDLPQRLTLMSGGALAPPPDGAWAVGPVKILLDDHNLPDLEDFAGRIAMARDWARQVAVHCVTAGELATALAAFEIAGARPGDRIEHGGVIPEAAIPQIRNLGLTVVTQPAFVLERGDRYLAEVDPAEHGDLYRSASLLAADVPLAASSDAPYASPDPWRAIRAAVSRRTLAGRSLGEAERLSARAALALYVDEPAAPGRVRRRVAPGAEADLCLLKAPMCEVLTQPDADLVAATVLGGRIIYDGKAPADATAHGRRAGE